MKAYSFHDFIEQFPDDDACLDYVLEQRFPRSRDARRIRGRKSYLTKAGKLIYPLKGSIFEKSRTPLTKWFYAIFLFANSRHSVSAKELQRQIGVTYKCAWRMTYQIRKLMAQDHSIQLQGVVEADETYIGGTRRLNSWKRPKIAVMGMVERGKGRGRLVLRTMGNSKRSEYEIAPLVEMHVAKGSYLYTDGAPVYNTMKGYKRGRVFHTRKEYVKGDVHTNSIESVWQKSKNSIRGTHKWISEKHLQSHLDYQVFLHNNRGREMFGAILERV